jgi:hypothetical protein
MLALQKREKVNPWSLYEPRNASKTRRSWWVDYPVRELVKREIANHPKRAFLSNAYRALRGSDEILRPRGFADQALYCVASRRELDLTSHL